MGVHKRQLIEAQEDERLQDLDFAEYQIDDCDEWWRAQDQDLEREELEKIESDAEIEEYRHMGYM